MSKGAKKVLGAVIIIILIVLVSWLGYESMNAEPASINATNEVQNENMGLDNEVNEVYEEEVNTEKEEEEQVEEDTTTIEEEPATEEETSTNTEVISGTNATREERAVSLAKEYYEKEYGSSDETDFNNQGVNGEGKYIIRVGSAGNGINIYLLVDLDTETVTEK